MKAIKIYKIEWNLDGLSEEKKAGLLKKLPTVLGSKVSNDFNVAQKVPVFLKKKYGYDINSFSFETYNIADNEEQLLRMCLNSKEAEMNIFTTSGKLTTVGQRAVEALKANVLWRVRIQNGGTDENEMPKLLDEVMLSLENISGMSWDEDGYNDVMLKVLKKIRDRHDDVKKSITAGFEDEDEYEDEDED